MKKNELEELFRAGIRLEGMPPPHDYSLPAHFNYAAPAANTIAYRGVPLWGVVEGAEFERFCFGIEHLDGHYYTLECVDQYGDAYTYGRKTLAGWREWLNNPEPIY